MVGLDLCLARKDLKFWSGSLESLQGKSWTPRTVVHRVFGDASATAYAGSSELLSAPMVMGHTQDEQERMRVQQLSSCFRETKNARLCIAALLAEKPDQVRGLMIVYIGDNQGSIHCLNNMSGNAEIFLEVRQLYLDAAKHDVLLGVQWQTRTTEELNYADSLSRTQDASQISLRPKMFQAVCKQPGWGYPTLDVFAGPLPEEHKASQYLTRFACAKSRGVNALVQRWDVANSQGRFGYFPHKS